MKKYKCQCCGCYTIDEPAGGSYDICPVCFWEDDRVQSDDPEYEGGANRPSLNQAKENYRKYGANDEWDIKYVRSPHSFEIVRNPEISYIELIYKITEQKDRIYLKCEVGNSEEYYRAKGGTWIKDQDAEELFSSGNGLLDIK